MISAIEDLKDKYTAADNQSSGIGGELAERVKMNRAAEQALKATPTPSSGAQKATASVPVVDKVNARPIKGEKRIPDSDLSNWAKPLGENPPKYHTGVDSVPKTGPAILKKGEKVVRAEDNPDNPDNKGKKESTSKHSPSEKAHFHRAMSTLHRGGLHRALGIPEDQDIPMEKKQSAAKSDNPHVAAMGRLAVAMHGWKGGEK